MRKNRNQEFLDKIKTITFGTGAKPVSTPEHKTEIITCSGCGASIEAMVLGEKKCADGGTLKWGIGRPLAAPHSRN